MKIQIIGFSGSGKSTLAKKLGEFHKIPYLHLDTVHFFDNWQERSIEEQSEIVSSFIKNNDSWVIDGNYTGVAKERFEIADITIFLNFNRFICYWRTLKRYWQHRGRTRESVGCIEKFDLEFQWWVLFKGRKKRRKKQMYENFNANKNKKLIFNNQRTLDKWVNEYMNMEVK